MPLAQHLSAYIHTMRSELDAANSLNWRLLHRNGFAWIEILLADIEPTREIERACFEATAAVQRFADFLGLHLVLPASEAERAKTGAHRALLKLEQALVEAVPSRRAEKLGYAW